MNTVVQLQVESEAAAKVFLPEAMPRWLVERYHSPEVRGTRNQGKSQAKKNENLFGVRGGPFGWPGSCDGVSVVYLLAGGIMTYATSSAFPLRLREYLTSTSSMRCCRWRKIIS